MDASSGCAKEADQTHCPSRFQLAAPKRIRRSGLVACYAANQALGTIWRGSKEDPDTKEIRNRATLRRSRTSAPATSLKPMLATQMVATHEAVMECPRHRRPRPLTMFD